MVVLRLSFLAVLIFGTIGALKLQPRPEAEAATIEITAEERARGLTFAPDVTAADREWILAAVAKARPEAARLLDEVDGLVTVKTFIDPGAWALGWAETTGPKRYEVRFNASRLNGSRRIDREVVVLHELGHVLDYAIVPGGLRDRLAAQVPRTGACPEGVRADCAPAQERFADTFAKWALRGAVSITGAGYNLPAPASLEDWGAPLSALAIQLDVSSSPPRENRVVRTAHVGTHVQGDECPSYPPALRAEGVWSQIHVATCSISAGSGACLSCAR